MIRAHPALGGTLGSILLTLIWTVPLLSQASSEDSSPVRAEVMILGTYHMANPGADDTNMEADDVTGSARQEELEELAGRLAAFAPDRIAVELPVSWAERVDRWYEDYLGDSLTAIPPSELDQISFRLAERLGHERVYPVDHRMGLAYRDVMEYAEAHGQGSQVPLARRANREATRATERIQAEGSVLDILAYLNSPAIDETHSFYLALAPVGEGEEYPGAEMVADWYERNLKIYTNIWRLAEGADRLLVVIGAGHSTLLRRFVEDAPDLELVPVASWLAREGPGERQH